MTKNMKAKQQVGRRSHGLVTVSEAAVILRKSRHTLYDWETAGQMPARATVTWGRRTYFRLADINELATRLSMNPPAEELASHE